MTLAIRPWILGAPAVALLTHRDSWSYCKRAIEAAVGSDTYTTWLMSLNFVEVKKWVIKLSVPSPFLKKWVDAHYLGPLLAACQGEWPAVTHVEIVVRTCVLRNTCTQPVLALPAPPKGQPPWVRYSPYTPQMLFPGHPGGLDGRREGKLKVEDIQRVVALHYGTSREDLLSGKRTAPVVKTRQVAMYLCKLLTGRSLPEIGRRFGGRDHTTVLHAFNKIAWNIGDRGEKPPKSLTNPRLAIDHKLREEVEMFKRQLAA